MRKIDHYDSFNGAPTHFCLNHMGKALRQGGKFVVTNGGKSRRWICAHCIEAKQARKEAANVAKA